MYPQRIHHLSALLCLICIAVPLSAQAGLRTRFAEDVSAEAPLAEYPRPQWKRERWQSLNGHWCYAVTPSSAERALQSEGEILVPFPLESALSGVARKLLPEERLWYWRKFRTDYVAARERLLLHFGAVDWEAVVWVDGQRVGEHRGGFDPFTCEIGWALNNAEEHEVVVAVWDPTDQGTQPRGKQVLEPNGIWYTPVSGIWQSVWLEPVPKIYLEQASLTPDLSQERLTIRALVNGALPGLRLVARATLDAVVIARAESDLVAKDGRILLELVLPEARPWSPENPVLYDLQLELYRGDQKLDAVVSYFGMRSIEVAADLHGIPRLRLNGVPYPQLGLLDQGYWPDGLYTAPTEEALRYDLEVTKALGFNMVRKHVKVEPERWYALCDRMGLLVWQDMPNGDASIGPNDADLKRSAQSARQHEQEQLAIITALENHPCIVTWVVFNEGWGQFDTERMTRLVRERDRTRLVNSASGWTDRNVGDFFDIHVYPGPALQGLARPRAAVLGEFGGLGLPLAGHTWQTEANWGYQSFETREALTAAYVRLMDEVPFLFARGLCAAIYTQTTDVEVEVNGLLTYDRATLKPDAESIKSANLRALRPAPALRNLVSAADESPELWRYTTSTPGDTWMLGPYDDASWKEGPAGFGKQETPSALVRTRWSSEEIWLRRNFQLESLPSGDIALWIHHDEDAEVYLNGSLVASLPGYRRSYGFVRLEALAKNLLRIGSNLLAVHCRQTSGGQYIDVGLMEWTNAGQ